MCLSPSHGTLQTGFQRMAMLFSPRALRLVCHSPKQRHTQPWQCLIALVIPLALTPLDLPNCQMFAHSRPNGMKDTAHRRQKETYQT